MSQRNRQYLSQYLDVIDVETNAQIGYLGDLSEDGLMFISALPLSIDSSKAIYIQNNLVSKDQEKFSVLAKIKILWIKPNLNPTLLCFGCSILDIDKADFAQLQKFVAEFSFGDDVKIERTSKDA